MLSAKAGTRTWALINGSIHFAHCFQVSSCWKALTGVLPFLLIALVPWEGPWEAFSASFLWWPPSTVFQDSSFSHFKDFGQTCSNHSHTCRTLRTVPCARKLQEGTPEGCCQFGTLKSCACVNMPAQLHKNSEPYPKHLGTNHHAMKRSESTLWPRHVEDRKATSGWGTLGFLRLESIDTSKSGAELWICLDCKCSRPKAGPCLTPQEKHPEPHFEWLFGWKIVLGSGWTVWKRPWPLITSN